MAAPSYTTSSTTLSPSPASSPASQPSTPVHRFLGINQANDKSADTAIANWKSRLNDCHDLYNDSPLAAMHGYADVRQGVIKITSYSSDHASVEKKTASNVKQWKFEADRELRGQAEVLQQLPDELKETIEYVTAMKIERAGGQEAWLQLSPKEQTDRGLQAWQELFIRIGQEKYDALSEQEKSSIDLFVWFGCCMHKDQNAAAAGVHALPPFWAEKGIEPVPLMNRDVAAAALHGDASAKDRAKRASTGGGWKLASLAGMSYILIDEMVIDIMDRASLQ